MMGAETGSAGGKHPEPPGFPVNYNARLELTRTGDASSRLMVFPDMWPFAVVIKRQFIRKAPGNITGTDWAQPRGAEFPTKAWKVRET